MSTSWSDSPRPAPAPLQRILLAAVIAANLAIAAIALAPNVPAAYRAYFITRTSDCLERPVDGGATVNEPMALTDHSSWTQHIVACGVADPEPDGTWTLGKRAELLVRIPKANYRATLDIADVFIAGIVHQQQVDVLVGGATVKTTTFTAGGSRQVGFSVPSSLLKADGVTSIAILLPDAQSSRARGEQRPLGIKLAAIRLDKLPD
jgi:hypothetical protein